MRRSLKELVALEDFLSVWYLALHINTWRRGRWKSMSRHGNLSNKHSNAYTFIDNCTTISDLANKSVLCYLDGSLLRSSNPFAYYFLMAFEAGSIIRAFILLLLYPIICFCHCFISDSCAIKLTIFITFCGIKESAVTGVALAVLPKFFLEDLHPHSYRVFVACGKRYIVTSNPRIMVEPFLREFLNVEHVLGTELQVTATGYCTGLVNCLLLGEFQEEVLRNYFLHRSPDIGIDHKRVESSLLSFCKDAYIVPKRKKVPAVSRKDYLKPLIFHDGRLAVRPSPSVALAIFLWIPFGLMLAIPRCIVAVTSPSVPLIGFLEALLGLIIRVKGTPPAPKTDKAKRGVLFVCTHRMLVDPLFVSLCALRRLTAVTYSISRISELLAPIKTIRLTRCRAQDGQAMRSLLEQGDLAVCPEGTTCREPYLLRFSSLFAELTDDIVPVAITVKEQLFHGSTARGWKAFDPLYFLLNPFPVYEIEFLDKVPHEMTCAAGKSSFEVANYVQKKLGDALGYECTNLTRKDKYRMLAGNDGIVKQTSNRGPRRFVQW